MKPIQYYFIGNRILASRYINYAEKHLRLTRERWKDSKLPVRTNVRKLADGAIIRVKDYLELSIIEIDVTGVKKIPLGGWKYHIGFEDQTADPFSYWMYNFELPDQSVGLDGTETNIEGKEVIKESSLADVFSWIPEGATSAFRYTIPYPDRTGIKSILYSYINYQNPSDTASIDELWSNGIRVRGDQPFYYNDAFDNRNIPFYGYGPMDPFIYQADSRRIYGWDHKFLTSISDYLNKVRADGDPNNLVVASYLYYINNDSFDGSRPPSLASGPALGRDSTDMGIFASVGPDGYLRYSWFKCESFTNNGDAASSTYSFTTGINRYDLKGHSKVLNDAKEDQNFDLSRFSSVEVKNLAVFNHPTEVTRTSGDMYSIDGISYMDRDAYRNGTVLKLFSLRYEDGWGWAFYGSGYPGQDPIDFENETYDVLFTIDETDLGFSFNEGKMGQIYVVSNTEMYISIGFLDTQSESHLHVFKVKYDEQAGWVKTKIHAYDIPPNPSATNSNDLHMTPMGRYLHINGYNAGYTMNNNEFYDVAYIYDQVSDISWNINKYLVNSAGSQIIGEPSYNSARKRYQGAMFFEQEEIEIT